MRGRSKIRKRWSHDRGESEFLYDALYTFLNDLHAQKTKWNKKMELVGQILYEEQKNK